MANNIPITTGTGSASVAGETVAGITYQQIEVYGAGGASVLGINPDGSIKASIIGTPAVTLSGSPSISGAVTVIGTPSISGSVNVPNTVSVAGAVQVAGASPASIMTVTRLDNQVIGSMLGMVGQVVIHGLTSAGGGGYVDVKVDPSGALVTAQSSVVSFQGGVWNVGTTLAIRSSLVSGAPSVITTTASTLLLAAAPSGQRNYVTQVLVTNAGAVAATVSLVEPGGAVIYSGYAAASGGGFSATFPSDSPLKQPTSVLALHALSSATASILVSASGYTAV